MIFWSSCPSSLLAFRRASGHDSTDIIAQQTLSIGLHSRCLGPTNCLKPTHITGISMVDMCVSRDRYVAMMIFYFGSRRRLCGVYRTQLTHTHTHPTTHHPPSILDNILTHVSNHATPQDRPAPIRTHARTDQHGPQASYDKTDENPPLERT